MVSAVPFVSHQQQSPGGTSFLMRRRWILQAPYLFQASFESCDLMLTGSLSSPPAGLQVYISFMYPGRALPFLEMKTVAQHVVYPGLDGHIDRDDIHRDCRDV